MTASPGWVVALVLLAIGSGGASGLPDRTELARNGAHIDAQCRILVARGRTALASGEFAGAVQSFDELIRLRNASPYLTGQVQGTHPADAFVRRLEQRLLDDAVGLKAFSLWRAGSVGEIDRTLGTAPAASLSFSARVAEHAGERFSAQRWDEAARAFTVALDYRLRARNGECDEECARQLYNRAMAELVAGRAAVAREVLGALRKQAPSYLAEQVGERIRVIDEMLSR